MKITKTTKMMAARLAIGAVFQGSALAGPATYLYWQESPLPHKHSNQAVRPILHSTAGKQTQKAKWTGMPRLLTVGQGVISIDQFDQ